MSVAATGETPLSYAWFAGESGDTRSPVANATSSTLRAPAPARYWVRVSNRCGVALSNAVTTSVDTNSRRRSVRK